MDLDRILIALGAISAFLGVGLGAFGAHGLRKRLSADMLNVFDIGVRYGDQVDKDMIAVRLTLDMPMAIVAAPGYFANRPVPASPQDLMKHNCIALRLASSGGLYAWELLHDGQPIEARVRGQARRGASGRAGARAGRR